MSVLNKLFASVAAASVLVGSSLSFAANAADSVEVKLGIVDTHYDEWINTAKNLEAEEIKLTIVNFADYTLPNRALNDGDIDLNAFQHRAYLKSESESNGYDLTAIANTIISPLGAYSDKIKNIDELKDGDIVAIPNDPTNGGRALKLLETAGVIKLDPSKGYLPTVNDVTEYVKKIEIKEVDASYTASLIPDVAVSIINSNYALDNNLLPTKDAIYLDTYGEVDEANPYVNILVARTADKDKEVFKKIVAAYQTEENAKIIEAQSKGASVPVFKY